MFLSLYKNIRSRLRLRHYFLIAFIVMLVAIIFPHYSQLERDHINTLRYFYSSVAQSIAAIIAIGAVFAIFGLEQIDGKMISFCKAFKEFIRRRVYDPDKMIEDKKKREVDEWLGKDVYYMLLAYFDKLKEKEKETLQPGFVDYFLELENLRKFKAQLKQEVWRATLSLIFTFMFSLVFLINVERISSDNLFVWTNLFLGISLLISLSFTVKYIAVVSHGPQEEYINNPLINSISDEVTKKREKRIREVEEKMIDRIKEEKEKWRNKFLV